MRKLILLSFLLYHLVLHNQHLAGMEINGQEMSMVELGFPVPILLPYLA